MQTFMPYSDFNKVAKCLDNKRLGKQRVEAWQIYLTLQKIKQRDELIFEASREFPMLISPMMEDHYKLMPIGWENHPIVKMWKEYELALIEYGQQMCFEWINRGFKDTLLSKFDQAFLNERKGHKSYSHPSWINDEELQLSHQSNLLRKDKEHYSKYFKNIPNNLPYKWIV